jgi:hypothetical protein
VGPVLLATCSGRETACTRRVGVQYAVHYAMSETVCYLEGVFLLASMEESENIRMTTILKLDGTTEVRRERGREGGHCKLGG